MRRHGRLCLYVVLKAPNDTMGDVLTPALLAYGIHPTLPFPDAKRSNMPQTERLLAQKTVLDEEVKIVDEQKLKIGKSVQSLSVVDDLL